MKTATDFIIQYWQTIAAIFTWTVVSIIILILSIKIRNLRQTVKGLTDNNEYLSKWYNEQVKLFTDKRDNRIKSHEADISFLRQTHANELATRDTYHAGQIKRLEADIRKVKDENRIKALDYVMKRVAFKTGKELCEHAEPIYRFLCGTNRTKAEYIRPTPTQNARPGLLRIGRSCC